MFTTHRGRALLAEVGDPPSPFGGCVSKSGSWPVLGHLSDSQNTQSVRELGERKGKVRKRRMDRTKFYNQKDFVKLRDQWYRKLARTGFKDIEVPIPGTGYVSDLFNQACMTSQIRYHYSPTEYFGKVAYWDLMRDFYNAMSESGILQKWQDQALRMVCLEGKTNAEIQKALKVSPERTRVLRKAAGRYVEGRLNGESGKSGDWVCVWCCQDRNRGSEVSEGREGDR